MPSLTQTRLDAALLALSQRLGRPVYDVTAIAHPGGKRLRCAATGDARTGLEILAAERSGEALLARVEGMHQGAELAGEDDPAAAAARAEALRRANAVAKGEAADPPQSAPVA